MRVFAIVLHLYQDVPDEPAIYNVLKEERNDRINGLPVISAQKSGTTHEESR